MGFNLSGSSITQTGTDTDLSGLSSVAGIVFTTNGRQIDGNGLTLRVEGNLTIDRSLNIARVQVAPSGNLIIGANDSEGFTSLANLFTQSNGRFFFDSPIPISADNGATISLNNAQITTVDNGHPTAGAAGTTAFGVFDRENWVFNAINSNIAIDDRAWLYFAGGGNIDGLSIRNTNSIFFHGSPNSTNNINVIDTAWGFGIDNNVGVTVVIKKSTTPRALIQRANNNFDFVDVRITDWVAGRSIDGGASSGFNFFKTISTRAVGPNASSVSTRYIFASDNSLLSSASLSPIGELSEEIKWGRITHVQTGIDFDETVPQGKIPVSQINDGTGHAPNEYKLPLKIAHVSYNGALSIQESINFDVTDESYVEDFVLAPNLVGDTNITEPNYANTTAYTEIETPQKFYDRAKAYLVDNYAGETAAIVSRSGNTIDAGSYNIVINDSGAAFAFDGTTITINAGTGFIGTINTTGTVTDTGSPRIIEYGVTGGQLIINDASATWTIDGNVVIDDVINNDTANNLVINVTGGGTVNTSEAGAGNGEVSIIASNTLTLTGILNPSKVYLFNTALLPTDQAYQLAAELVTNGTFSYSYNANDNLTAEYRIVNLSAVVVEQTIILGNADINIPITQQTDRNYENN